jgi:hypothetical protein
MWSGSDIADVIASNGLIVSDLRKERLATLIEAAKPAAPEGRERSLGE